jgi:hypothetical protein
LANRIGFKPKMIQYFSFQYNVIFFAGGENYKINNSNLLKFGLGMLGSPLVVSRFIGDFSLWGVAVGFGSWGTSGVG